MYNGAPALSFAVSPHPGQEVYPSGAGIILDSTYTILTAVTDTPKNAKFDIHEFRVNDEDSTGLFIYNPPIRHSAESSQDLRFGDLGFAEIHLPTRELLFEWEASQHILRNTSTKPRPSGTSHGIWDWLSVVLVLAN